MKQEEITSNIMMQAFKFTHCKISSGDSIDDDQLIGISIRCFGAVFYIRYLPGNLAASSYLLAEHVRSLGIMRGDDDIQSDEQIWILKNPFERLMEDTAPKPTSVNHLFDYLYPLYLVLEARAADKDSIEIQPHFKGSIPRQLLDAQVNICLYGKSRQPRNLWL
ncbi:hypothetical protein CJF32_00009046 [Rutstroemia sp. NJR-2017a WRK4]|nr:hypothetical protein CJF32_00009046 [Rutstroemia sp. NJR-2017a WRK4]